MIKVRGVGCPNGLSFPCARVLRGATQKKNTCCRLTRPRAAAFGPRPTRDPPATHRRPTRDPPATNPRPTCDPPATYPRLSPTPLTLIGNCRGYSIFDPGILIFAFETSLLLQRKIWKPVLSPKLYFLIFIVLIYFINFEVILTYVNQFK